MSESRKEFLALIMEKIIKELEVLEFHLEEAKDKWVVASEGHVFVGEGKGSNGIGFAVRGVAYESYPEYPSFTDALRNIDPYLIDGAGKPIYNKPMKAIDFYSEEISCLKGCLQTVQELSRK